MTTLPLNYLRLSSKWLETNVAPEDVIFHYPYDALWGPSQYQGKLIPSYDRSQFTYATARTDLPKEAYADEPGAEVASERAEDRITGWVNCPVCGEPDMRRTEDPEGNPLIFCVNHACRSNGGANDDAITQDALEAEREKHKETAKDFETEFRLVRQENDTLRVQLDAKEGELRRIKAPSVDEGSLKGLKIEYNDIDNRFYVYAADGSFLWSGDAFFNAWQCARLTAELEAKEAECRELRELSERRAETIAVAMHNQKVADQDHASTVSCIRSENDKLRAEVEELKENLENSRANFRDALETSLKKNPIIARLTAELDAVRKERDAEVHQTEAFIRALGHGWSGTKTIEDRQEFLKAIHQSYLRWIEWKEEAQARCGALERALRNLDTAIADTFWISDDGNTQRPGTPEDGDVGEKLEKAWTEARSLLTPSQQPDNFDSSGGESRTAIAGADGSKHTKGDCNPQGSESRKANPKIASESSASPAVNAQPDGPETNVHSPGPTLEAPLGSVARPDSEATSAQAIGPFCQCPDRGTGMHEPTCLYCEPSRPEPVKAVAGCDLCDGTGKVLVMGGYVPCLACLNLLSPIAPEGKATEGEG